MSMPLLIGGATTSRQHTAVKIAPEYDGPGRPCDRRVKGRGRRGAAARSGAAAQLDAANRADQERLRVQYAALKRRPLVPWPEAEREAAATGGRVAIAMPAFTGAR